MTHAPHRPLLLIVDDIPLNVHALATGLKDHYRIKVATSGAKALELAQGDEPPDLVLLDVMMPGMDGYQVCRRLKEEERTREIPVIFVTARDEEENEAQGLACGAIDYITKPIKPEIVRARVRNHLLLKQARDALAEKNRALEEAARLREEVERITRHDMKTPISAIIGMSELLLEEAGLAGDHQEWLEALRHAAYRALDMINVSLVLYKIETGTYQLEPRELDALPLLRKVWRDQLRVAEAKGLALGLTVAGREPMPGERFPLWGEELLLHTLFGNLLVNAVQASPPGERVTIALEREGGHARIHLHNQGAVPEAIRERFFEKYATAGKSGGTGLGTYSALLMAQAHHGALAMTTDDAHGTTVTLTLPTPPEAEPLRPWDQ